jgi:hypothetical protein
MPRQARLDAPGVLHHIMIRGIERRKIFTYVHLNPVRSGIVPGLKELNVYLLRAQYTDGQEREAVAGCGEGVFFAFGQSVSWGCRLENWPGGWK